MAFSKKRAAGSAAEDLAAKWLGKNGYRIVERNWESRGFEIDIVAVDASDKKTICFVEVRSRA